MSWHVGVGALELGLVVLVCRVLRLKGKDSGGVGPGRVGVQDQVGELIAHTTGIDSDGRVNDDIAVSELYEQ